MDWTEAQKEAFVRSQFEAQHRYYQENYHDTSFDLILADGEPIGRLYVAHWAEEIRIVDIAILPAYRGAGIGTHLIRQVFAEAAATGRAVRIHVEPMNPARRLYERLGFTPIGEHGVYILMEWRPASGPSTQPTVS